MHLQRVAVVAVLAWSGVASSQAPVPPVSPRAPAAAPVRPVPQPPRPASGQEAAVRVLLVADKETVLSSPVTAKIRTLQATLGAPFQAGQTLVSFECDESLARQAMATAELAGAVESHEARIRMQGLDQASDVEVALAASAVAKARGQVDLQKAQVAQCTLRAPWSGRVAKVHVRDQMSVTPGQPMVDLVKSGPLRLRMNAPSRALTRLRVQARFNVAIDETGKRYEARVQAVNSRIDPVSQTIEIEAVMSQAYPELLPGMSGVADLDMLR